MDIGTVIFLAVLAGLACYLVVDTLLFHLRWRSLHERDAALRADLDRQLAELSVETHVDEWQRRFRPRLDNEDDDDG